MLAMVRVIFDGVESEVTSPVRLMDVCDDLGAPVPFSCRDGNCGTCAVLVDDGHALLSTCSAAEQRTLTETKAPKGARLACQTRITAERGVVKIRVVAKAEP